MPGIPGYDPLNPTANLIRKAGMSVALVDAFGRVSRTRVSNLGAQDLAIGEKSRFTEAVGNVSNMGAFGWTTDNENYRLSSDAIVYDEAYSDAANILYMVLQNNEGRTIPVEVPAPQAELFAEDGVTLIEPAAEAVNDTPEQAKVRELIAATLNLVNTSYLPVNSYVLKTAYRTTRKRKLPRPSSAKPTVEEPAANTGTSG